MPRIQVTYSISDERDVEIQKVVVQVRQKGSNDDWREAGYALGSSNVVYADGVEEQVTYEVRLYAFSASGATSEFSSIHDAYVIGRTTSPPAPTAVHLDGSRIWWEMPEDYPIDVRGWEVFMGFDEEDPFEYALKISSPYTTAMEFDIERWSGWSRRVWVRTVDDAGLASRPASVAINLGNAILDNVVITIAENQERGWPGQIQNGSIANNKLVPSSSSSFWHGDFWKRQDFWLSTATDSMIYETELQVPEEAVNSYLTIQIDMPDGGLGSLEYQMEGMVSYAPLPNEIYIENQGVIRLRVTTMAATPGIINEIKWIFDVEDQMETINDLYVPEGGIRLPLKQLYR